MTTVDKEETLATTDRAVMIPIGGKTVRKDTSKEIATAGKDSKAAARIGKAIVPAGVKTNSIRTAIWAIPMTVTSVVE